MGWPSFYGGEQGILIATSELRCRIAEVTARFSDDELALFLADKIVMAEVLHAPAHGLHYYLGSLYPLLLERKINCGLIQEIGNVVISNGTGGIGFLHLDKCLSKASEIARDKGIALCVLQMPGKVGALRVYCNKYMERGQLILMLKNTARMVGTTGTGEPVIGTNPLCIGLPDTHFIYDSSTATVATNKPRLADKCQYVFPYPVGVDKDLVPTNSPSTITAEGGYLLPFSHGPYWFKSFFLGVAIEAMAGLAGGSTGRRVGKHDGQRLHSREGMLALLVDKHVFPFYENYLNEATLLLKEIRSCGLHIPGEHDSNTPQVMVFRKDWEMLGSL
jgi:LDH2 family malate/lactate/ureidoglycolate dehydrogenase